MSNTLSPPTIIGTPRQRNQHLPGLHDDEAARPSTSTSHTPKSTLQNALVEDNTTQSPTAFDWVVMATDWVVSARVDGHQQAVGAAPLGTRHALEAATGSSARQPPTPPSRQHHPVEQVARLGGSGAALRDAPRTAGGGAAQWRRARSDRTHDPAQHD